MKLLETLLFLWLTPGMVFTIPPIDGKWFCTETTSWKAVLVHAAVFAVAAYMLKRIKLVEGFQDPLAQQPPAAPKQRTAGSNKRRIEERLAEKQYFGAI